MSSDSLQISLLEDQKRLLNDNINKVPRDLAEVGPEQKQFRSSVQMFGRVENTAYALTQSQNPANFNIG